MNILDSFKILNRFNRNDISIENGLYMYSFGNGPESSPIQLYIADF